MSEIVKFLIPVPGKGNALIEIPELTDSIDWEMLSDMVAAYVQRSLHKGPQVLEPVKIIDPRMNKTPASDLEAK